MKQIIPFKQELLFKTKISEITSISLEHTLSLKEEDLISGEFLITGDYKMTEGSINREKFSFQLPFEIALDSRYDVDNLVIDIDNFYYEVVNNEYLKVNIDVYFDGNKIEEVETTKVVEEETDQEEDRTLEEIEEKEVIESIPLASEEREEVKASEELQSSEDEVSILGEHNKNIIEKNIDYKKVEQELELMDSNVAPVEQKVVDIEANKGDVKVDHSGETIDHSMNSSVMNVGVAPMLQNGQGKSQSEDGKDSVIHNEFHLFENIDNSDTYVTYHVYIVKEDDTIDTIIDKYGVSKEDITNYNDISSINPGDKIVIPHTNE